MAYINGKKVVQVVKVVDNGGGGGAAINDNTIATDSTWSSQKINNEITSPLKNRTYDAEGGTYYQPRATIDWTSVRALTYNEDNSVYIYGDLMEGQLPATYFNFMEDNEITYYSARMFGYDENNQVALYCIFDTAGFDMYGNILKANQWYKIPLGTGTYVAEEVANTDIPNWNLDTTQILNQTAFALLFAEATASQTLEQKVTEIENNINSLFTTTTDATLVSGTYELALTYLTEIPKANDIIAYVNGGAITTLYKVTAVDSTKATLTKIGDIGGGKIYQHNVKMWFGTVNAETTSIVISVLSRDNTPLNPISLCELLYSRGFTTMNKVFKVNGWDNDGSNYFNYGYVNSSNQFILHTTANNFLTYYASNPYSSGKHQDTVEEI